MIKNGHEVVEIVALLSPAVEDGANALDGSGEDALAEVRLIKVDHCLTAGNRFSIFDDTHAGCCVNGSLCAIVEATGAGIRANGEIGVHCHGLELVKGLRFLCGGDGVLNNETGVFREGRFFLNGTTIVGSSHDWFLLSKMFFWVNTLSDEK